MSQFIGKVPFESCQPDYFGINLELKLNWFIDLKIWLAKKDVFRTNVFNYLPIFILTYLLNNTHVAEILLDDTLILPLDDAVALLVIDGRPTKDAFEGEQAYFDLYFFC